MQKEMNVWFDKLSKRGNRRSKYEYMKETKLQLRLQKLSLMHL